MTAIEYLDRPPTGWFVLDMMRKEARKRDRVALMVDVDPDHLDWSRTARSALVCIPGKHRTIHAAWGALQDMTATRH